MGNFVTAGEVTDDSVIWRMRIACYISKATNTYLEYVIRVLIAFAQQWLTVRA